MAFACPTVVHCQCPRPFVLALFRDVGPSMVRSRTGVFNKSWWRFEDGICARVQECYHIETFHCESKYHFLLDETLGSPLGMFAFGGLKRCWPVGVFVQWSRCVVQLRRVITCSENICVVFLWQMCWQHKTHIHVCLHHFSVLTPIKFVENVAVKELLDIISVLFIQQKYTSKFTSKQLFNVNFNIVFKTTH